jgi:glycosyltransferase involved in cell wall biosynthesis
MARALLHYMRSWDARSANGVDHLIANSRFVGRRISKTYRRDYSVLYPPVQVEAFELAARKDEFYLTASRFVPYKKIDLIVEAFAKMPQRRLVVIGDGPQMQKIRAKAGPNVAILGYQSFEVLKDHMQRAKAFVFAAEEDFGISVVEAQACGTPVIAFGKGGALETVRNLKQADPTGLFFMQQSVGALQAAVEEFERNIGRFTPRACRANAERFSAPRFRLAFTTLVQHLFDLQQDALHVPCGEQPQPLALLAGFARENSAAGRMPVIARAPQVAVREAVVFES